MTRSQSILYSVAKQEFKDQMDPTDLSRSFYVNATGDVIGFVIVRSNEKVLAYDAAENKYCYSSQDEPTIFDNILSDSILDLPPYNYHTGPEGERTLYETHAFPDPSTTSIYESLRLLRNGAKGNQFSIALAMTNLLRTHLTDHELSIMANKAVLMYTNSPHNFALNEITAAINSLIINGTSGYCLGNKYDESFDGHCLKQTLLTADQETFNILVAHTAQENRNCIYSGAAFSQLPKPILETKLERTVACLQHTQLQIHKSSETTSNTA